MRQYSKASRRLLDYRQRKGAVTRPFRFCGYRRAYLIALSVIAEVQAPDGSLVMIFWSSSALAVRS